jgi:hypothetical protein
LRGAVGLPCVSWAPRTLTPSLFSSTENPFAHRGKARSGALQASISAGRKRLPKFPRPNFPMHRPPMTMHARSIPSSSLTANNEWDWGGPFQWFTPNPSSPTYFRPSDEQTGSYSESEGSLGYSGLLSPGLSGYRTCAFEAISATAFVCQTQAHGALLYLWRADVVGHAHGHEKYRPGGDNRPKAKVKPEYPQWIVSAIPPAMLRRRKSQSFRGTLLQQFFTLRAAEFGNSLGGSRRVKFRSTNWTGN